MSAARALRRGRVVPPCSVWTHHAQLLHPEAQRVRVDAQALGAITLAVDPPARAWRTYSMCTRCTSSRLSTSRTVRLSGLSDERRIELQRVADRRRSSRARRRSRALSRCPATSRCCSDCITACGTFVIGRPSSRWRRWMKNQPAVGCRPGAHERRQINRIDTQAVVQVGAEAALGDVGFEIVMVAAITRTSTGLREDRRARTRLPAARAGISLECPAPDRRFRRGRSCRRRPARSAPAASPRRP